jgi:hypothetical protein
MDRGVQGDIMPLTGSADPDDAWCEFSPTAICHDRVSSYVATTKGNGKYGVGTQPLGNIDVVIRTNLNGRAGRWTVKLFWDDGPRVDFSILAVNCWEDMGWLPDPNCGTHYVSGTPWVGPTKPKYQSSTIYGNQLADANDYYAEVWGVFQADGWEEYPILLDSLKTMSFICPTGNGGCYFP